MLVVGEQRRLLPTEAHESAYGFVKSMMHRPRWARLMPTRLPTQMTLTHALQRQTP